MNPDYGGNGASCQVAKELCVWLVQQPQVSTDNLTPSSPTLKTAKSIYIRIKNWKGWPGSVFSGKIQP